MALRDVQALFFRALTWPTGVADFLSKADASTRREFEATFAESTSFSRIERVDVYANAYFYRLAAVLAEQFELVAWLARPDPFHNLVTDYVLACPSRDPDLRRFGARFPAFIADHAIARHVPGLDELARVEWARLQALDGADEAPLDIAALRALPLDEWPRLRLRVAGTARLLSSRWDVTELLRERSESGTEGPATTRAAPHPNPVLVYRQGLRVSSRNLATPEAAALRALMEGATFAELCERARAEDASAEPPVVAGWLREWLELGLIVGAGVA